MTGGPRRIALVQAGLGAGGTEKIIRLLATHLHRQGHAVTVLAIGGRPQEGFYLMPDGVVVRTVEEECGTARARSTLARIRWLRRALRQSKAELVISFLTKINIQVAVASLGLGLGRIASERNNFLRQPMHPLWQQMMPVALGTAEAVVMLTEGSLRALPAWAQRRALVIPNPSPANLASAEVCLPPRRLIAVGRLTGQKGFDVLIRAIHIARTRHCELDLTIYGEGEERQQLTALAESLGVSEHVRLPGRSRTPHDWVDGGGIFVLSSRYEGFANVLVEAMAAGFAVVSTDCDWGPSEIVTHDWDGLLVPPEDPERLADAIVRLWEDEALRSRLAAAARQRAAEFCEECILSKWDQVIAEAFGPRLGRTGEPRPLLS